MEELAGPDKLDAVVADIAARIGADYKGRVPVVVCVLKGAFVFTADLIRRLDIPVELDFIRASSYGEGCESSGCVRITRELDTDVTGRDVIVVEDILDTGRTLDAVVRHIAASSPASIRCCALLDKPSRRVVEFSADYVGMEIEDLFVVGYGLDHAEKHRNLPGIFVLGPQD